MNPRIYVFESGLIVIGEPVRAGMTIRRALRVIPVDNQNVGFAPVCLGAANPFRVEVGVSAAIADYEPEQGLADGWLSIVSGVSLPVRKPVLVKTVNNLRN